jgi:hypothetical protein
VTIENLLRYRDLQSNFFNKDASIPCLRKTFKCPLNLSHMHVSQLQKYLLLLELMIFCIFRYFDVFAFGKTMKLSPKA